MPFCTSTTSRLMYIGIFIWLNRFGIYNNLLFDDLRNGYEENT
ncbi:hypothetical protein JCM19297_966 [Nonlabens ulvanivorans]|nr:hypothetical protein JCM19297_966 [Nonlabens ulvanivorans]